MIIPKEIVKFCNDNNLTLLIYDKEDLTVDENTMVVKASFAKIPDYDFKHYDEVPIAMFGDTNFTKTKNILNFSCSAHMMVLDELDMKDYQDGYFVSMGSAFSSYASKGFTAAGNIIKNIKKEHII